MKRIVAILVLFAALPTGAHASTSMGAPYASDSHYTQCQWVASQTGVGTCTMKSASNRKTGALSVDATMASPDSPAGKNTLPTWGQAVAEADVLTGYHLTSKKARSIKFDITWHITRVATLVRGLPNLAWVNPIVLMDGRGVDCQCAHTAATAKLPLLGSGTDVVNSIELLAPQQTFSPGTFVIQAGFQAQAGLENSFGRTQTLITGSVRKITVTVTEA